jgi:hypothetical protein
MSQPLSFADQLSFLRWLLGHTTELPQLLNAFADFQAAPTVRGKWEAVKKGGDLLVAIFDDGPFNKPTTANSDQPLFSLAEFHAQVNDLAIAAAFDGERVQKLVALITEFLPLLLKLFGK